MMPKSILVPLDESPFAERAIRVARALATQLGADLAYFAARGDGTASQAERYLEFAVAEYGPADVLFSDDTQAGHAIAAAAEAGDRLVCMTSHGRGSLRWAVLGSVAEDVIRESHRPVVLVGRHCGTDWPDGFRTAVVCLDGADAADAIIPIATEWAQALDLRVHVVHVIHPLDVEGAEHPDKAVQANVAQLREAGLDVRSVLLRSRLTGAAVADHASSVPGAIVMMSSQSHTGISRCLARQRHHAGRRHVVLSGPRCPHRGKEHAMSDYDVGSPTVRVRVYEEGGLVATIRCESADEAADIAADWEERPGYRCEVEDGATDHEPEDVLAPEPEDVEPEVEYRNSNT